MGTLPRPQDLPQIISKAGTLAAVKYPVIQQFLQSAADGKIAVKAVVAETNEDGFERLERRRHDLQSAIRTLALAAESLAEGYRFADDRGPSKIAAISKAVSIVESEGGLALQLLDWNV